MATIGYNDPHTVQNRIIGTYPYLADSQYSPGNNEGQVANWWKK